MRISRPVKFALLGLAVLLATAIGYGVYLLARLAPIGTAYAAKMLCSGVFVGGRPADEVIHEDIVADNHPLLRLVQPSLDVTRQLATATFLGMARRDAQYRRGLGCTIVIGTSPERLLAAASSEVDSAVARSSEGLPVAPPAQSADAGKLQSAVDSAFAEPDPNRLSRTRAVVVVQNGRIIAERYAPGFSADSPMQGWSMTKTVTGILIGTLVKADKLSLEQKALVHEWSGAGDRRADITLGQLLRMTSGLRFTESYGNPVEDVALMLFARADGAAYAIDKPLEATPGSRWQYSSGTSNILSHIIRQAVAGSERDYLEYPRRALFDRIGMRNATIEPDSSNTFVGSSFMYASARDWARLGQFLLQDGVWNGERILPAGWVTYMATLTPQSKRKDFGAHLWVKVPPPFDSVAVPRPRLPPDTFHSVGHEGQFVSIIPSRKLVVVRLGLSRGNHVWDEEAFLARVLEACPG